MLKWNTRQVNDIDTNPLDCYWAVGMVSTYPRLYRIIEQYPADTNGMVTGDKPELYVLFEEINGRRVYDVFTKEDEVKEWKYAKKWGDCWFKGEGIFIHAYKTLDEAKARAEVQISHIQGIMDSYFSDNKIDDNCK